MTEPKLPYRVRIHSIPIEDIPVLHTGEVVMPPGSTATATLSVNWRAEVTHAHCFCRAETRPWGWRAICCLCGATVPADVTVHDTNPR